MKLAKVRGGGVPLEARLSSAAASAAITRSSVSRPAASIAPSSSAPALGAEQRIAWGGAAVLEVPETTTTSGASAPTISPTQKQRARPTQTRTRGVDRAATDRARRKESLEERRASGRFGTSGLRMLRKQNPWLMPSASQHGSHTNRLSDRLSGARHLDGQLNSSGGGGSGGGNGERVAERSGVGAVGARRDSRITFASLHGGGGGTSAAAGGEHGGSDSEHGSAHSAHSGHSSHHSHSGTDSEGGSSAHDHHGGAHSGHSGHDDSGDSAHEGSADHGTPFRRAQVPLTYEQAADAVAALKTGYGPKQLYSGAATYRALIDAGAQFTVQVDLNGQAVPGPTMMNVVSATTVKKKKKGGRKKGHKKGGATGHKKKKKKKKKK